MTTNKQGITPVLSDSDLKELARWNTPAVYNGWEQITACNAATDGVNLEEVRDFMPHLGPLVGYAVTVKIEPGNPEHPQNHPMAWSQYRRYVAEAVGPKIVVVQDLDKPRAVGSFWGEVNSTFHRALGCIGTITDGAIRDLDEMTKVSFKALARTLCVGHAYSWPVEWGCEVEVFGRKVQPGQLIHADQHGFLAIPQEDESKLLEAVRFTDREECRMMIATGLNYTAYTAQELLDRFDQAHARFSAKTRGRFGGKGEW